MRKLLPFSLLALTLPQPLVAAPLSAPACVTAERLNDGPVIHPGLDPSITDNVQGPSLIRVPDWVKGRLGRYYLYFASHKGDSIRLAFADDLKGPWKIHPGGTLKLSESLFPTELAGVPIEKKHQDNHQAHIASPDVHVDEVNRRIVLYYHGILEPMNQQTRLPFPMTEWPSRQGRNCWDLPISVSSSIRASAMRWLCRAFFTDQGTDCQVSNAGPPCLKQTNGTPPSSSAVMNCSYSGPGPEMLRNGSTLAGSISAKTGHIGKPVNQ